MLELWNLRVGGGGCDGNELSAQLRFWTPGLSGPHAYPVGVDPSEADPGRRIGLIN